MPYPPASLVTTYGTASDLTGRPGRLAPVENDVLVAIDEIVTELGSDPSGGYPDVTARLAALSAGQSGFKLSVRAMTVYGPAYVLATSFANGQVLDGVTLATGNRVLLTTMSDPTQNGIYTVNASGPPTRATDYAASPDILGTAVYVREGTANAGRTMVNTNTSTITVGTTGLTFGPQAVRPASVVITASNQSHIQGDFACDGTADEFEINLALFFLSISAVNRADIHLTPGDFYLGSSIVIGASGISLTGTGKAATLIHRTADVIGVDLSGSGTGAHVSGGRLAGLGFTGTTGGTQPAVRLYYADGVEVESVDFTSMTSMGILLLECWDSHVVRCHFTNVGTAGLGVRGGFGAGNTGTTGGRPSVLIVGDTAASGFGHTLSNSNGLRFRDCIFDGATDGALQVHGNSAAENFPAQVASRPTDILIDGCQFNALSGRSGWAPQVNLYKCDQVDIPYAALTIGNWFTGGSARNILNVDTCTSVHVGRLVCQGVEANTSQATWLRFTGGCVGVSYDLITLDATTAPVTAVVDLGTSTGVRRGTVMQQSGPAATIITGVPTSEYRTTGTATIPTGGATSIVVTHRLPRTPVDGEVIVWAVSKPSTNDPGHIWVDTYTATQFTVHCTVAPTGTGLVVGWRAQVDDNA